MGRKKKMKTEEKVELRMRLDAELMKRIQEVAEGEGLAVAAYMRNLAIRDLKRREREGEK